MRGYRVPMILSGLNLVLLAWLVLTTSTSANGQSETGGTSSAPPIRSLRLAHRTQREGGGEDRRAPRQSQSAAAACVHPAHA